MSTSPPAGLLRRRFVTSWIGQARPGDLTDPQLNVRAAAWAHWAVSSLAEMTSHDRRYPAVVLPGRFYTSNNSAPTVAPHLEIPARVLSHPDQTFPLRLAAVGNGLRFAQWIVPEVTAVRRAVFSPCPGDAAAFVTALDTQRPALVAAVAEATARLRQHWDRLAGDLVTDPGPLSTLVCADASADEVCRFAPALAAWRPRLTFDPQLRERSGDKAARRVGVWVLETGADTDTVRIGAVTPRLTASSLWSDDLFDPYREGLAALVARGVVLDRLLALADLDPVPATPLTDNDSEPLTLRAIPARPGAEMPRAGVDSAVAFLQAYPTTAAAWEAVEAWAQRTNATLTITRAAHAAAHVACIRSLRRAEDPDRDDVDVLLPLVWVGTKVARLSVVRGRR